MSGTPSTSWQGSRPLSELREGPLPEEQWEYWTLVCHSLHTHLTVKHILRGSRVEVSKSVSCPGPNFKKKKRKKNMLEPGRAGSWVSILVSHLNTDNHQGSNPGNLPTVSETPRRQHTSRDSWKSHSNMFYILDILTRIIKFLETL